MFHETQMVFVLNFIFKITSKNTPENLGPPSTCGPVGMCLMCLVVSGALNFGRLPMAMVYCFSIFAVWGELTSQKGLFSRIHLLHCFMCFIHTMLQPEFTLRAYPHL